VAPPGSGTGGAASNNPGTGSAGSSQGSSGSGGTTAPSGGSSGGTTPSGGSGGTTPSGGSGGTTPSGGGNSGGSSPGGSSGGSDPGGSSGSGSGGTSTTPSGGTGSGSGASTPPSSGGLTVDNASPSVNLLSSTTVHVTVPTSATGTVALSTQGLPSDVTASFDNTSVAAGSTATLTLTTLSSTVSQTVSFTVTGTGGLTAALSLTVNPTITIFIPVNVDANQGTAQNPNTAAFGAYPILITAPQNFPVTVNFENLDSTPHEIHAEQADQGFPHGNGLIPQDGFDQPRNVTQSGTYDWHLHDEGDATTVGEIIIM